MKLIIKHRTHPDEQLDICRWFSIYTVLRKSFPFCSGVAEGFFETIDRCKDGRQMDRQKDRIRY